MASVKRPPKICIPSSEKMKMNRKRITSKELMEEMELTRDFTRFPMAAQYLRGVGERWGTGRDGSGPGLELSGTCYGFLNACCLKTSHHGYSTISMDMEGKLNIE